MERSKRENETENDVYKSMVNLDFQFSSFASGKYTEVPFEEVNRCYTSM